MSHLRYTIVTLLGGIPLLAALLTHSGCGGTTTGNGILAVNFGAYNKLVWWQEIIPSAYATVSSITFCFKRVRFKTQDIPSTDPVNDPDNQDFSIGAVAISASGTPLKSITIPLDIYTRAEFDLEDNCGLGYSVSVSNSNGTFTTADSITAAFQGSFFMHQSSMTVSLGIQAIINALNTVASGADIKNNIQSVSGNL